MSKHVDPQIQNNVLAPGLPSISELRDTFLGPSVEDIEIDGLDLETAAERLGIGTDDLWRRIRNGQVMARSQRGKVYIYTNSDSYHTNAHQNESRSTQERDKPQTSAGASKPDHLPPLPTGEQATQIVLTRIQNSLSPESGLTSVGNQDLALLMDHLNLAKEENREIIRLTQESMARLTEMTDEMLQMKDDVISAREQQVDLLTERLQTQASQLRAALREKENLETLTRALMVPVDQD